MEEKINNDVTRTGETDIRLNLIDSFPNHPYHVFDDEDMTELTASIEANGLLNPIIVRSKADGRYGLISGHRRKRAYEILKIKKIRAIIVDVTDDEAIIMMVDSRTENRPLCYVITYLKQCQYYPQHREPSPVLLVPCVTLVISFLILRSL